MSNAPTVSAPVSSQRALVAHEKQAMISFLNLPAEVESKLHHGDSVTNNILLPAAQLLRKIFSKLRENNVPVTKILLIGSAASHMFNPQRKFNDVDFVFKIEISNEIIKIVYENVMVSLYEALRDMMLEGPEKERCRRNLSMIQEMYINKKFFFNKKEGSQDVWSLFSLNHPLKNIELKFVHHIGRDYQFTMDSLQIDVTPIVLGETSDILLSSGFGNIEQVVRDVCQNRIRTKNPNEIYGGGFLKYCQLLNRGFEDNLSRRDKRKMITKFLTDFETVLGGIYCPVARHLANHFQRDQKDEKIAFLEKVLEKIGAKNNHAGHLIGVVTYQLARVLNDS